MLCILIAKRAKSNRWLEFAKDLMTGRRLLSNQRKRHFGAGYLVNFYLLFAPDRVK